jgi:KUP system potassium uptake protein
VIGSMLVDAVVPRLNAAKFLARRLVPAPDRLGVLHLLMTWKRGRTLMFRRLSEQGIPLKPFLEGWTRIPHQGAGHRDLHDAAVDTVPHALLHNLKHNKVLHEQTVFLTIVTHDVPVVRRGPRAVRAAAERLLQARGVVRLQGAARHRPEILISLPRCAATRASPSGS